MAVVDISSPSKRRSRFVPAIEPPAFLITPRDVEITTQLKAAGSILGIDLLDHIIFNRMGYFSFLEEGKL